MTYWATNSKRINHLKRLILSNVLTIALPLSANAQTMDEPMRGWVSANASSYEPEFFRLATTNHLNIFLGNKAVCDSSNSKPIVITRDFIADVQSATNSLIKSYSRLLSLIGHYTSDLTKSSTSIALIIDGNFKCANSGSSTFDFLDPSIGKKATIEDQPFISIGLDQIRSYPESTFSTLSHEIGHVLMGQLGIEETLLDETIPDFLEIAFNNWDHRIGLGLGSELQAEIKRILADPTISSEVRRYQEMRLSFSSMEALRDLKNAKTLNELGHLSNPYFISVYINSFFWKLSQLAPKQLLQDAFFESLLNKSRYKITFAGKGLNFVSDVVNNLIKKSPELIQNKDFQTLLKRNGIESMLSRETTRGPK